MIISDKYDLLQYLVDGMDSNNRFSIKSKEILNFVNTHDLSQMLTELKTDGFIAVYLGGECLIYNKAIHFLDERNASKSTATKMKKASVKTVNWVFGIITSLITALLAAYIIWRFGWN